MRTEAVVSEKKAKHEFAGDAMPPRTWKNCTHCGKRHDRYNPVYCPDCWWKFVAYKEVSRIDAHEYRLTIEFDD